MPHNDQNQLTIHHIRPPKDMLFLRLGAICVIILTAMILLNNVHPVEEPTNTVEVASIGSN